MKIGWITDDFAKIPGGEMPGGCAFYRCYLPLFASRLPGTMGRPAWTGERGFGVKDGHMKAQFGFDTVVTKLLMARWVPAQMQIAQSLGQRVIVDVDDLYDEIHDSNQAKGWSDPEVNKVQNRAIYDQSIMLADTVTVTTPYLLNHYVAKGHPDVRMIRNGVLPTQFDPRHVRNTRPVIGWVGMINYRSNDLEELRSWLPDFLEEHDLRFHHSGVLHDATESIADLIGFDPARLTTSPAVPFHRYKDLFTFDIGIVPLSDIPFNHAKSALKGLEYASAGIPFVAQGLPEYQRIAEEGVGRVAVTPGDWRREMTALLDYKTRKREAACNLSEVYRRHTIEAVAPEWQGLLLEAVPSFSIGLRS